jgi:RES domain-containing protein
MRHIDRGGSYLRVADPDWADPLSGRYARDAGGRWNPAGAFEVVHLNADRQVARAQVRHKLEPVGVGPEDLDPDRGPVLIRTSVPRQSHVDAITDRGLSSLGLPESYPLDNRGRPVPHGVCQPIGQEAWNNDEPGIACRSRASAPTAGEELAYFNRGKKLKVEGEEGFSEWFWR